MSTESQIYYVRSSDTKIAELGECGGALTTFMKFLLESEMVDGVLTVKRGTDIYDAVPVLICDSCEIGETAGSLHCGTLNIAKILVEYFDEVPDMKLAITVKPCEAETILELDKRGKINLNNFILVGVNCGGTFPPVHTRNMIRNVFRINPDEIINEKIEEGKFISENKKGLKKEISIDQLEKGIYENPEEIGENSLEFKADKNGKTVIYGRRSNCKRCEMNIPTSAHLGFGNWGVLGDYSGEYSCVEVFSELGAEILDKTIEAGFLLVEEVPKEALEIRKKIDKSMANLAKKWQLQDFKETEEDIILNIFSSYHSEFEKCIKCFGCKNACPICYCQECTLELSTPEWVSKGKIPPSPLFHLERLIHMVESCTNCGQCEDVCPMDIPLAKIWHQINQKINELKYSPGMDKQDLDLFEYFERPD